MFLIVFFLLPRFLQDVGSLSKNHTLTQRKDRAWSGYEGGPAKGPVLQAWANLSPQDGRTTKLQSVRKQEKIK